MEMVKIMTCSMKNCAYNGGNKCHALAITVGGPEPMCDTFIVEPINAGFRDIIGSVGACRVKDCRFNDKLECTAQSISVGEHSTHADCKTFLKK